MMDSVVITLVLLLSWFFSIVWYLELGIFTTLILTASILAVLVTYFRANYIRAFLNFRIGNETVEANLLHVHKENTDVLDWDLEASEGIIPFQLTDWGSRRRDTFHFPENNDGAIKLPSKGRELFLMVIRYDGKVTFRPIYWWVHFWPPEMFRIMRGVDANTEMLPDSGERVLQDSNALIINNQMRPTYDNLAYQPTRDKVSFPLRRSSVRQELDHYTSGHNIFLPLWVELPGADDTFPDWLDDDYKRYGIRIVVDPPNLPLRVSKWLELEIVDFDCAQKWINEKV